MAVSLDVEVVGVKDALRELRRFDRPLSNELRRNARKIMQPIVLDAQRQIPTRALSGWDNSWTSAKSGVQLLPWDAYKARSYVKAKTSTKQPREYAGITRDISAFYVSWAGGVNALFDMAGRRNKSVMAANLTGKFGPPSRIMWPAAEKNAPEVEAQMKVVIDRLMDVYNTKIRGLK
jgi:hypothetical protein